MSILKDLHLVISQLEKDGKIALADKLNSVFMRVADLQSDPDKTENDEQYSVPDTFQDKLNSNDYKMCPDCNGEGFTIEYDSGGKPIIKSCITCGGYGKIRSVQNHWDTNAPSSLQQSAMRRTLSKRGLPSREVEYGHKSPPKGYPKKKVQYADPKNYKYPLDTEKHVRAAWSYIHMPRNRKMYTASELAAMEAKIKRAGKKYGIDFRDEEED